MKPKILTEDHKQNTVTREQSFVICYYEQGDNFVGCIVTGDELGYLTHG